MDERPSRYEPDPEAWKARRRELRVFVFGFLFVFFCFAALSFYPFPVPEHDENTIGTVFVALFRENAAGVATIILLVAVLVLISFFVSTSGSARWLELSGSHIIIRRLRRTTTIPYRDIAYLRFQEKGKSPKKKPEILLYSLGGEITAEWPHPNAPGDFLNDLRNRIFQATGRYPAEAEPEDGAEAGGVDGPRTQWAGVLLMLAIMVCFCYDSPPFRSMFYTQYVIRHGEEVVAEIEAVSVVENDRACTVTYGYAPESGRPHRREANLAGDGCRRYSQGDSLTIRYLSTAPGDSRLPEEAEDWRSITYRVLNGLMAVILGIAVLFMIRGDPVSRCGSAPPGETPDIVKAAGEEPASGERLLFRYGSEKAKELWAIGAGGVLVGILACMADKGAFSTIAVGFLFLGLLWTVTVFATIVRSVELTGEELVLHYLWGGRAVRYADVEGYLVLKRPVRRSPFRFWKHHRFLVKKRDGKHAVSLWADWKGYPRFYSEFLRRTEAAAGSPPVPLLDPREEAAVVRGEKCRNRVVAYSALFLLAAFLFFPALDEWLLKRRLLEKGVWTEGAVTARIDREESGDRKPRLEYAFQDGSGKTVTLRRREPWPVWDRFPAGTPVGIVFLPDDPRIFRTWDDMHIDPMPYGYMAAVLAIAAAGAVLSLCLISVYRRRGTACSIPPPG